MSINFSRPGETQLSGGHIGKTVSANSKASRPDSNATSGTPPQRGDSVQLSSNALQIQNLSEKLSNSPNTVDAEKVARLKAAIDNGSYSVDSRQVADKMLELEATFD